MNEQLIGREPELEQLRVWLAEARSGRASVLFLTGEAGMGKTTSARAVLRDSGWDTVEGFGLQDGTSPYGPIITVLRQLLRGRATRLERPMRSYLAVLLPELGPAAVGSDRAGLFEAIRSALVLGASERPLVVFLDDLQWADDATLELLPAMARSLDHEPIAILGAYRSDDIPRGHPVRRARAELRRAGRFREIALDPLDASATAELLARTLGAAPAPSLSVAVFDRTDGVPFFVEELGAGLATSGRLRAGPSGLELLEGEDMPVPDSVRDAVLLQAGGLSEEARFAVMVAAVAGQVFDPDLVMAIAGVKEWPDELILRGLVVGAKPDLMAFRHALIRDAFYGELSWTQRVGLHRSVAERLEAIAAPAVIVAEHWAKGREPDRARRAFAEAADAFGAVHAYRDGMRAARRALELWPEASEQSGRLEILEQLAAYAELAGDLGEAIATWREAAERRERDDDAFRLAEVRRRLATALELQGRWEEGLAWRERAAAAFDAAASPAHAAEERLASAAHLRSAARFRAALGLLGSALGDARLAGRFDLEVRIIGLEGNVRARMGEGTQAVELVRTALTMALDRDLSGPAAEIYQRLADSLEHTRATTPRQGTPTT